MYEPIVHAMLYSCSLGIKQVWARALLIQGARQVGKSYIVEAFAKTRDLGRVDSVKRRILRLNRDRTTLKCYMADTGQLVSHTFDEVGVVGDETYKKIMMGKLEVNMGMVVENAAAQMLAASGHRLLFFTNSGKYDAENRMEIDFLVTKGKITSRHNVSPIEVKSGPRYTYTSLRKFMSKYGEQLGTPYIVHTDDLREENGIVFVPLYMVPFL